MPLHPHLDEHGQPVTIKHPHAPSPLAAWSDPRQTATAVPGGELPAALNGVPLAPWDAPADRVAWHRLAEAMAVAEPDFDPRGREPAAGAVVVEDDGRIWIVAPTNAFMGTRATFPKGKAKGMGLKATALKEVFEESGLRVELTGHLVDNTRSTSRTRYYLARRVGGSPAAMGWESQAVLLAPAGQLRTVLTLPVDHQVASALEEHLRKSAQGGNADVDLPQ